ncbi:hypothetical protein [Streptomyces longwoodensis]|uniref:hypothetical protein n=1 Tax=Streptomyces longwoodensis TaxID=68231 RepID=UPI0036FE6A8B
MTEEPEIHPASPHAKMLNFLSESDRALADQPGADHQHTWDRTHATWPSGPDGETDRLVGCACGATATRANDEGDDGLTDEERAVGDRLYEAVAASVDTEAALAEVKARARGRAEGRAEAEERVIAEAIKLYRSRDQLINRPDQRALLVEVTAMAAGLRVALCALRGWDVRAESDKEGKADELIVGRWQEQHPEEWAVPDGCPAPGNHHNPNHYCIVPGAGS